jgi:hypothetical protein
MHLLVLNATISSEPHPYKDLWERPFELNQVLKLVQEGMILRDRFKGA